MWMLGALMLGAGVLTMPIIGFIPSIIAIIAGAGLAVLGCAQEERETQAARKRKLANYPTYKY